MRIFTSHNLNKATNDQCSNAVNNTVTLFSANKELHPCILLETETNEINAAQFVIIEMRSINSKKKAGWMDDKPSPPKEASNKIHIELPIISTILAHFTIEKPVLCAIGKSMSLVIYLSYYALPSWLDLKHPKLLRTLASYPTPASIHGFLV
jgi:hypothetical protein